ncbi:MAG: hypothetical protein ACFB22_03150 [Rhodothalassiaceae bacterium]
MRSLAYMGLVVAGAVVALAARLPMAAAQMPLADPQSRSVTETAPESPGMHWLDGYIEATGRARAEPPGSRRDLRLRALAAARRAAEAELLTRLAALPVSGRHRLGEMQPDGPAMADRLRFAARSAVSVLEEISWLPDDRGREVADSVITVRLCLTDQAPACLRYNATARGLYGLLDLHTLKPQASLFEPSRSELQAAREALNTMAPTAGFSGLIVHTDGLGYRPKLAPMLMIDDGHMVFGPAMVAPQGYRAAGPVAYAPTEAQAKSLAAPGPTPLVVHARAVDGEGRLVLSTEDAAKIMAASAANGHFLSRGRLTIVLN